MNGLYNHARYSLPGGVSLVMRAPMRRFVSTTPRRSAVISYLIVSGISCWSKTALRSLTWLEVKSRTRRRMASLTSRKRSTCFPVSEKREPSGPHFCRGTGSIRVSNILHVQVVVAPVFSAQGRRFQRPALRRAVSLSSPPGSFSPLLSENRAVMISTLCLDDKVCNRSGGTVNENGKLMAVCW